MGRLRDIFFGRSKLTEAHDDRLFALSTAEITFVTELDLNHQKRAGIVFKPLETGNFNQIIGEVEQLLDQSEAETGTGVESETDSFGYRWMIFRDAEFTDLLTTLNIVSSSLMDEGYGEQLLCAVFPFKNRHQKTVYWVFNFKHDRFYPFVPLDESKKKRDVEEELRMQAAIGHELPVESDSTNWFALWGIPI